MLIAKQIKFPKDLLDSLKIKAKSKNINLSALIKLILTEYLKKPSKKL
jgi:hypothetical protein